MSVLIEDWTLNPETGCTNDSSAYRTLVHEVAKMIRDEAPRLLHGNVEVAARLIVSQLAHRHGLAPVRRPTE